MNDEDIKKTLEDFYHRAENTNLSYYIFESEREALKDALALINRQQAEIERLQNTIDDVLDREPLLVERAEKYAIEEFTERLKAKTYLDNGLNGFLRSMVIDVNDIDNLLIERAGEQNA